MKTRKIYIKKYIINTSFILVSLASILSCTSLSKSSIIYNKKDETISILELKIINDGNEEIRNSGIFGECHLIFGNDNGKVKYSNKKNHSFYILKTKNGIIKIKALKCSDWTYYFKNRYLDFGDLEFLVKPDKINYLGNLVVNYESSGFGFLDIFGLGSIFEDKNGTYDIKIYDNSEKSLNFLREYYPELKFRKITKSLIYQSRNQKAKIKELDQLENDKKDQAINNDFIFDDKKIEQIDNQNSQKNLNNSKPQFSPSNENLNNNNKKSDQLDQKDSINSSNLNKNDNNFDNPIIQNKSYQDNKLSQSQDQPKNDYNNFNQAKPITSIEEKNYPISNNQSSSNESYQSPIDIEKNNKSIEINKLTNDNQENSIRKIIKKNQLEKQINTNNKFKTELNNIFDDSSNLRRKYRPAEIQQ